MEGINWVDKDLIKGTKQRTSGQFCGRLQCGLALVCLVLAAYGDSAAAPEPAQAVAFEASELAADNAGATCDEPSAAKVTPAISGLAADTRALL